MKSLPVIWVLITIQSLCCMTISMTQHDSGGPSTFTVNQDCRILDGGLQAWKAEGYILRQGEQVPLLSPGSFEASQPSASWVAGMYEVWRSKSDSDVQLWDNRETDEWRGTILKKGAFRKGRIPWARFLNWSEFKKKVDSNNKNPTEVQNGCGNA